MERISIQYSLQILLLLSSLIAASIGALTPQEVARFRNAGRCGGSVTLAKHSETYELKTNGLPDHYWDCVNSYTPLISWRSWTLAKEPVLLDTPLCSSIGIIGVAVNGVFIMNPLAIGDINAVKCEDFDMCGAHATPRGQYHYHQLPVNPDCDNPIYDVTNPEAQLIGIALDGHPIYSQGNYQGVNLDASGLDECHGQMLPDNRYAYIAVKDNFPYMIGCFRSQTADCQRKECPETGGAPGMLCHCSMTGNITWYDYESVDVPAFTTADWQAGRFRRSPRLDLRQHGTVASCAYDPSVLDSSSKCPKAADGGNSTKSVGRIFNAACVVEMPDDGDEGDLNDMTTENDSTADRFQTSDSYSLINQATTTENYANGDHSMSNERSPSTNVPLLTDHQKSTDPPLSTYFPFTTEDTLTTESDETDYYVEDYFTSGQYVALNGESQFDVDEKNITHTNDEVITGI